MNSTKLIKKLIAKYGEENCLNCFWCNCCFDLNATNGIKNYRTVDHIIPQAVKHTNMHHIDNLVFCCWGCNQERSRVLQGYLHHNKTLDLIMYLETKNSSNGKKLTKNTRKKLKNMVEVIRLNEKWISIEMEKLGESVSKVFEFDEIPQELLEKYQLDSLTRV